MSTPTSSTAQKPLRTGYGPQTTAEEVLAGIDLTGRVAVVTGGYSGLGLETTRALHAAGATVIVPVRDPGKAASALDGMPGVEQERLDLADPDSIDAFAARVLASGRPIDMLINNAGVMAVSLHHDGRGIERHLAVNHLGHADLTWRLWPALTAAGRAGGARVVNVTSRAYRFSRLHFDDLNYNERPYDKWAAYGQSATARAAFTVALDAHGRKSGVRSFAVHPGTILTDLSRHLSRAELISLGAVDEHGAPLTPPGYKTVAQGAATTVWAATSRQLDGLGGAYLDDGDIAPLVDSSTDPYGPGVDPWLLNQATAQHLWTRTEQLLGRSCPTNSSTEQAHR